MLVREVKSFSVPFREFLTYYIYLFLVSFYGKNKKKYSVCSGSRHDDII